MNWKCFENDMLFDYLWKHMWSINDSFQIYLQFVCWITKLFKVIDSKQTVPMYLLPMEKPITNYEAIIEMYNFWITKVQSHHFRCWCSNQRISCAVESTRKWKTCCYGFFGAIGSYISGSALEKALCELGMCQPSFKRTVLSVKECTHCQTLHKTFAMEIERLYVQMMYPKRLNLLNLCKSTSQVINL